jgi:hypothetical protein
VPGGSTDVPAGCNTGGAGRSMGELGGAAPPRAAVSVFYVRWAVRGLEDGYRRPRHDLHRRQDAAAVPSAREALAWLGKGPAPGGLRPLSSARSR